MINQHTTKCLFISLALIGCMPEEIPTQTSEFEIVEEPADTEVAENIEPDSDVELAENIEPGKNNAGPWIGDYVPTYPLRLDVNSNNKWCYEDASSPSSCEPWPAMAAPIITIQNGSLIFRIPEGICATYVTRNPDALTWEEGDAPVPDWIGFTTEGPADVPYPGDAGYRLTMTEGPCQ